MDRFPALELALGAGSSRPLRLRPFGEDDIPTVTRACADALTQQWLPLPSPYTREDAARFIAVCETVRTSGSGVNCAVTLVDAVTLVGCVGLKQTDWRSRVTEIGYWAVPEHRGHGYTTAAAHGISRWALQEGGMERVELMAAPGNPASNRVAVGAGFRFEGLRRNAGFIHAGRVDLNLYAMTADDVRPDRAGAR